MYYNFRWFYDYSGGQLTNFGVHYMDIDSLAPGKRIPARGDSDGRQICGRG
jgi:hypothetical protein